MFREELFLHRQAGFFPRVKPPIEVINGAKIQLLKYRQRLGAAGPSGTVNDVRFAFVQTGDALLEIGGAKVDVGRASDASGLELFGGADIEHDGLFFSDKFVRLLGIDVRDYGIRGFWSGAVRSTGSGATAQDAENDGKGSTAGEQGRGYHGA